MVQCLVVCALCCVVLHCALLCGRVFVVLGACVGIGVGVASCCCCVLDCVRCCCCVVLCCVGVGVGVVLSYGLRCCVMWCGCG